MDYSISSISNRDLQLLYEYRILRQPVEFINAVYTQSEPTELSFGSGIEDSQGWFFLTSVDIPRNKVPMLEIQGDNAQALSALTTISFDEDSGEVILHSESDSIEGLTFKVYWISSLEAIQDLLKSYALQLEELQKLLEQLSSTAAAPASNALTLTGGVKDNLIEVGEDGTSIQDSGYRIAKSVVSQDFVNPTNEDLARLVKEIGGDILISVDSTESTYLQDFYGTGCITLSGSGTWYLSNIKNQVRFENFKGDVVARSCPYLQTTATAAISECTLINSFLIHNRGAIGELNLQLGSAVKQNSGSIHNLTAVGAGCEYYSALYSSVGEPAFDLKSIQGTVCLSNGDIWIHGKQVSFIAGHHDDPMQPSKVKIVVGGEGS